MPNKILSFLSFQAPRRNPSVHIPSGWPTEGKVFFSKFATRYRQGLDLVLNDISCQVQPGEKVKYIITSQNMNPIIFMH